MGMNLVCRSASTYDSRGGSLFPSTLAKGVTRSRQVEVPLPNPDPTNYKIISSKQIKNNLVVEIKYPDCTNYEGHKLMVYLNTTIEELLAQKSIDPHFSNNRKKISPFARFEPTDLGREFAEYVATRRC